MKGFFVPEKDSKSYTSVVKYLFFSVNVILISYYIKEYFTNMDYTGLFVEIILSITVALKLVCVISLVPIFIEIINISHIRILNILSKKRVGKETDICEILKKLERIHNYFFIIKKNETNY